MLCSDQGDRDSSILEAIWKYFFGKQSIGIGPHSEDVAQQGRTKHDFLALPNSNFVSNQEAANHIPRYLRLGLGMRD